MPVAEIEIINKLGLHARASAKLSQLAAQFPCEILLSRNGRQINAKSIMGVMMLAAGIGSTVTNLGLRPMCRCRDTCFLAPNVRTSIFGR